MQQKIKKIIQRQIPYREVTHRLLISGLQCWLFWFTKYHLGKSHTDCWYQTSMLVVVIYKVPYFERDVPVLEAIILGDSSYMQRDLCRTSTHRQSLKGGTLWYVSVSLWIWSLTLLCTRTPENEPSILRRSLNFCSCLALYSWIHNFKGLKMVLYLLN